MIGPAGFGVIAIDASGVSVTVSEVVPEMPEAKKVAVMVTVPVDVPAVTKPVLLMVALAVSPVVQVTNVVKSCVMVVVPPVDKSGNTAAALNWWDVPTAIYGLAGVMATDCGSVT